VIHANLSQDVESFLQESGRAGRDGNSATSIVLIGPNELQKASRLDDTHPFCRLFSALAQTQRCKRQALLELLKFPEESCSGCDVCDGTAFGDADGELQIVRLIRTYPFRFNVSTCTHLLCGSRSEHLCRPILRSNPFFAVLKSWRAEDIERAIMCLVSFKRVRMCRVPGFRGSLFVPMKSGPVQLE
jgi:ATP-dependent DNA helicase RecQ